MRIALTLLFTIFVASASAQVDEIDSLERILPTLAPDTNQIKVLRRLCNAYWHKDTKKGLVYGRRAIALAKDHGDIWLARTHNTLGIGYSMASMYDSARLILLEALQYGKQAKNNRLVTLSYLNLGIVYDYMANYQAALEAYIEGLKIAEKFNIDTQQDLLGSIASVYRSLGEWGKALPYDSMALAKAASFNEAPDRVILLKGNMAGSLINIGQLAKARPLLLECAAFHEKTGELLYLANEYRNLALIELRERKYYLARDYYQKAIKLNEQLRNGLDLSNGYLDLARLEFSSGSIPISKKYASLAFAVSDSGQFTAIKAEASSLLSKIALYQKDIPTSNFYDSIENYLRDSLNFEQQRKVVADVNTKYETEKKETENEMLRQRQLVQENKLTNQTYAIVIIVVTALGLGIVLMVVYRSRQNSKKTNELLARQKEEITIQKEEIEVRNKNLEEKSLQIRDSISYAKRIQEAILPPIENFNRVFPNSFVLYLPKDVVAGDLYWMYEIRPGLALVAAGDCTGHGVPGAIVSVICTNILNQVTKEKGVYTPGAILDQALSTLVNFFLRSENRVSDGMDVSLALIDTQSRMVQWAGANNPLWIVKNEGLVVESIAPNKQTIGINETVQPFTTHTLQLAPNDCIYLFTDGFADQFGGPKGKKIMQRGLKELLVTLQALNMAEQKERLDQFFKEWKGSEVQTDDVCVIGIRV